jgi:hypothetical protein
LIQICTFKEGNYTLFADVLMNSGLMGDQWLPICSKCQEEVQECCVDVELTLFPDEIGPFLKEDPSNLIEYEDGTFGYEKSGNCCFLSVDNKCQLQQSGITKPVDCLIYPINYKNGKIFIDNSCWAKNLISKQKAISYLNKKLEKFPFYNSIKYEERNSDVFITNLPVV